MARAIRIRLVWARLLLRRRRRTDSTWWRKRIPLAPTIPNTRRSCRKSKLLVRNSYMRRTTIPRLARTLCHRRERSAMRATSWAPTATTASKSRETKRTTTRCCTPRIIRRMTSPTRRCSSSSPHTRRPITANRRTPSPRSVTIPSTCSSGPSNKPVKTPLVPIFATPSQV